MPKNQKQIKKRKTKKNKEKSKKRKTKKNFLMSLNTVALGGNKKLKLIYDVR